MSMPGYACRLYVPGYLYSPMIWRVKRRGKTPGYGQPTDANLAKYIADFEQDCLTGVNQHLGAQKVKRATIINQTTGDVVARYEAS
jgi:hypothetical protein